MASDVPTERDRLRALAEALERLAGGDLSVRLPVPRGDAEAHVAQAFNRAAERLQERFGGSLQSDLLALQRRLARAERLAALGASAANLAHELGTPLHSVAGHLDLLLGETDLPPAVKERAAIVAGEVERLDLLIRRHLKRLQSPEPEIALANLNALVNRIMGVMQPVLSVRAIESELDLDRRVAEPFPCDARQVEQVLMNLVQNALDAMPEGGKLVIRTAVTETGRAISVCDDGKGVPPDRLERVFEPFYTTKAAGGGTGLGLSLCREIARGHGGDIALDSKPGFGTVVTLTLEAPPGDAEP